MSVSAKRATAVDWQLPAEQVARSINAGARARRALETYCAVFRIELHQAEAIETIHNSAPGTLVSIDGKSCTVVAGDRRLVRVTDSTTSFLGGQTPYLKEIVGGAGLKAPIVLGPSRSGAPDDPYWLRARHAWQRVASRLLVLYLGGSPEDALQTVVRSRDSGVDPIVIDLAAEGDLQVRYPWLDVRTPQDYADSPSVRQARQRAARWMQEIPHRRLIMSSRSFLETITDGGTPTWWRMEISLQERAFLSVRLVETVKEIIRIEHVGRATIVGGGGGWVAELLRATCRVAGVAVDEVGAAERPAPFSWARPKRRWRRVPVGSGVYYRLLRPLSAKAAALVVGIPLLAAFGLVGFIGVVLLPLTLPLAIVVLRGTYLLTRRLPWAKVRRYVPTSPTKLFTFVTGLPTSPARLSVVAAVAALTIAAWILLVIGLWESPLTVLALLGAFVFVIFVLYAMLVLTAPTYLGVDGLVRWSLASVRQLPFALQPRRLMRSLMWRRPARPIVDSRRRYRVALLVDEGNVRSRRGAGRRVPGLYNPYFEGIEDAFAAVKDASVVVISYGTRPLATGAVGRLTYRLRRGRRVLLRSYIDDVDWERLDLTREARRRELDALRDDSGFRVAWRYQEVDLWPAMAELFAEMFEHSAYAVVYQAALGRALDVLRPDLLVAYNFEGVFRRLLPAVIQRSIPLLGVQQALGPYVHSLGPTKAKRNRPLAHNPLGMPMPDRIAVWGQRDIRLLTSYGHPPDSLVPTGYARTDTFLREARAVLRPKVLGRLDLPRNARVVIYSAVLRVLGGPLLRDDQWRDSLKAICELRDDIPELRIVVKPWPGDDRDRLQRLMDEVADERVLYVDPDVDLHNVDLLSIADCVVGTFSSFLGEALLARAVPVLLDLPGTRYYFGDEVEHYRGIAMWASSPRGARNAVRRVVIGGEEFRDGFVRAAWPRLREIFGPLDGEAAKRIASAGIELLESARR